MNAESILSTHEELEVKNAIIQAEQQTSGEIRVHLCDSTEVDHYKTALSVFKKLKMHKTQLHNGVLIHLNIPSKQITIIGDKGINNVVENNFWQDVVNLMIKHFKKEEFLEGFKNGIALIGQKLSQYFPYKNDDVDELPNEITKN